ncbi:MAG: InlB B-repeat-containing protein, partial [Clostridia bacterium]|nr:InlB B-repeat-containing protein [Clostridia bacterium]
MKSLKRKFLAIIGFCLSLSLLAFFASCGENKITVEFATNGGSEIASVELDAGAECAAPQTPVKAGYEFAGWYDNEALSGAAVVFPVTLNENATYYAKWTKLYTLTLDAAGGSVSTGSITLKAGASVSDAIKNITPEYAHREFAGWYNGAGKVSSGLSMPAADLTLTAKYKVEYSVEIYLQTGKDSSAYQQSETVKGYEFAGTSFTASVKKEGYKAVSKPETVATRTISENYEENLYRLYYDIECYDIEFSAAYPDGSNATRTYSLSYGEDMDAPYDIFEAQGYVLAGWADESGKLKYKVDYLNAVAVNGAGGKAIV